MSRSSRRLEAARRHLRPVAKRARRAAWRVRVEREMRAARPGSADLAVFHDFQVAPAGGANQALRAVLAEMERRGVRICIGAIPPNTRALLLNSFNFDVDRFELLRRKARDVRVVHRVGAVTSLYRGYDDGTDARVASINERFAHATIAISQATLRMYREIGIELVSPRVIYNGCDPRIFHPNGRIEFERGRKVKLITTSWSDNPNKGGPLYRWLERHLNWDRYEFTYVGRTTEEFERIRYVPPLPSNDLADELRRHDIFVTATRKDAYSNALVEALSCGLPAIYLDSGGSAEAVKEAGFPFTSQEEIPLLLDRLVDEYEKRQAAISLPSLADIVDQYLETLGLGDLGRDDVGG